MAKEKINIEEAARLAQTLFHAQYDGHPEVWLSYLCSDSVYLGTGEPLLFGQDAIRKRFQVFSEMTTEIIQEEYFPTALSNEAAQVCGQITVQGKNGAYRTVTRFTLIFRIIGGEMKLLHQHNSYEYIKQGESDSLHMDINTIQFVRNLLLDRQAGRRIPIRSGNQTLFINPYTVLYVESQRKRTEFVCLDRVISCNSSIGEIFPQLPNVFYPIHRGYLVNTLFIVSIRRYEAELISGMSVPIPMQTYMQIKKELKNKISQTVMNETANLK